MAIPFPGLDVPVVNPQTGLMTQTWYDYFKFHQKLAQLPDVLDHCADKRTSPVVQLHNEAVDARRELSCLLTGRYPGCSLISGSSAGVSSLRYPQCTRKLSVWPSEVRVCFPRRSKQIKIYTF